MLAAMQFQTKGNAMASRALLQRCSLSVKQPFATHEHSITVTLYDLVCSQPKVAVGAQGSLHKTMLYALVHSKGNKNRN